MHEDLKMDINNIIDKHLNQACTIGTYGYFWEMLKYEIRLFSTKKGKSLAKAKR